MIYPENRQQVQDAINKVQETKTALVPQSSGAPHIHGASENPLAETICFEKMNSILKIDRNNRYARVEPGVTFGQLLPELSKHGLRMNKPFLPRANKSVVASLLEREAVLMPKYQYDYIDPLLTAEVVYGTGEVFHTGSAAGPGPVEELKADMVCPWGPGAIDFVRFLCGAQGTMGMVTWVTMKLEIKESASKLFFVECEDLSKLTKLASNLLFKRIPDDCIILNRVNFSAAFSKDSSDEAKLREKAAPWTLICRICGYDRYSDERIEIYSGYLKEEAETLGLMVLDGPSRISDIAAYVDERLSDCDRSDIYWKMRSGGLREILFLAPPSKVSAYTELLNKDLEGDFGGKLGITIQPQVQGRGFRVECDVYFNPETEAEMVTAYAEKKERELFAAGAFFDRPYGDLADVVFAADPVGTDAIKRMKNTFDPAGIFNPGKLCF